MTTHRPSRKDSLLLKFAIPASIISLFVVAALWLIKTEMTRTGAPISTAVEAGSPLPDLTLTRLDQTQIRLSEVQAKVVLINFWATWCEACIAEMPSLVSLRNRYKEKGFEVLGVNLDESPAAIVPKVVKQFQIDFPIYQDLDGKISDLLDVHAIPFTLVIDKQRQILFSKNGEYDWDSKIIHSRLEQWLAR